MSEVPKRHPPMEPLYTAYSDTIAGQNNTDDCGCDEVLRTVASQFVSTSCDARSVHAGARKLLKNNLTQISNDQ